MLAEAEDIESNLVGELDFLDKIAQALMRSDAVVRWRQADIGESVEAKFHDWVLNGSWHQSLRTGGTGCQ